MAHIFSSPIILFQSHTSIFRFSPTIRLSNPFFRLSIPFTPTLRLFNPLSHSHFYSSHYHHLPVVTHVSITVVITICFPSLFKLPLIFWFTALHLLCLPFTLSCDIHVFPFYFISIAFSVCRLFPNFPIIWFSFL